MRAASYEDNQVVRVGAAVPVDPGPGQVQIRVSHCGICGTDLHIFHGHMDYRVTFPQIIGHEMSGVVNATGDGVSAWKPGDHVTVRPLDPCGQCPACNAGHSLSHQVEPPRAVLIAPAAPPASAKPRPIAKIVPKAKKEQLVRKLKVAVLDFDSGAAKPEVGQNVSDLVADKLTADGVFSVIGREQVQNQAQKQVQNQVPKQETRPPATPESAAAIGR